MRRPLTWALVLGAAALMLTVYMAASALVLLLSAPPSSSFGGHQVGPLLVTVDTCTGDGRGISVSRLERDWYAVKIDCPY